jgi:hypothetical protein
MIGLCALSRRAAAPVAVLNDFFSGIVFAAVRARGRVPILCGDEATPER